MSFENPDYCIISHARSQLFLEVNHSTRLLEQRRFYTYLFLFLSFFFGQGVLMHQTESRHQRPVALLVEEALATDHDLVLDFSAEIAKIV